MPCTIYSRPHPAAAPAVRTLLVNPNTAARQALGIVLELQTAAHIVAQVRSCADARTELDDLDLVVVDQQLPDGICLDLVPALQAASPTAHLLVWTPDSAPSVLRRACEAAAVRVVPKSAGAQALYSAVREIADHQAPPAVEEDKREEGEEFLGERVARRLREAGLHARCETCATCHGDGMCKGCQGYGRVLAQARRGACLPCNGSGWMTRGGQRIWCLECGGRGWRVSGVQRPRLDSYA